MLLFDVEDASSFGAQHPLVAVGGNEINGSGLNVQWEHSHSLNRIQHDEYAFVMRQLANVVHVDSPTSGVANPTDSENSGAIIDRVDNAIQVNSTVAELRRNVLRRLWILGGTKGKDWREIRWTV